MILRKHLAAAAMAATLVAGGLTAASAQTLTVTSSSVTGAAPTFTYTYTLSSSIPLNQLTFNFSDPDPFTGITTTGPLALTSMNAAAGLYNFSNPTTALAANTGDTFTFTSPDAPGGTLGAVGISYAGSGVDSVNGMTPAPAAAPEPGSLVSMAVLSTCLGLGIVARRRRMLVG